MQELIIIGVEVFEITSPESPYQSKKEQKRRAICQPEARIEANEKNQFEIMSH